MAAERGATPIAVVGAAGRMGRLLVKLIDASSEWTLTGALEAGETAQSIFDVGVIAGVGTIGVALTASPDEAFQKAQVVVDFSAPPSVAQTVPVCSRLHVPLVVASTSLTPAHRDILVQASAEIPVLVSPNFSLGVQVMRHLVRQASMLLLDKGFEPELFELHHRGKKDAPSGTVHLLAEAIHTNTGPYTSVDRIASPGLRAAQTLGIAALRGGDVTGEHTVFFLGDGERIEITHRATSPEILPKGALLAARWLLGRSPGLYDMRHVCGLPT
jgi:4-hydroxy-tetrahydrodipicolinate reductase